MITLLHLLAYTLLLFLNLVVSIPGAAVAIQDKDNDLNATEAIVTVVLAIVWLFLLPLSALFCWFMPSYYAYR